MFQLILLAILIGIGVLAYAVWVDDQPSPVSIQLEEEGLLPLCTDVVQLVNVEWVCAEGLESWPPPMYAPLHGIPSFSHMRAK